MCEHTPFNSSAHFILMVLNGFLTDPPLKIQDYFYNLIWNDDGWRLWWIWPLLPDVGMKKGYEGH